MLLWKTLYAVFLGHNEMPESDSEQATYHAVSVVGTLLLQIGEVGSKIDKQLKLGDSDSEDNNFQLILLGTMFKSMSLETVAIPS